MAELTPRMQWPYPTEDEDPWFSKEVDFKVAADASAYAAREDRHLIFAEGGSVSWVLGTETLAWSAIIQIAAPITGFLWQIAAGSIVLENGEAMYVTLGRGPGANTTVSVAKASSIPSTDNTLIVAIRIGDVIWFRNGLRLGDGDTATSISPGSGSSGGGDLQTSYGLGEVINQTDARGAVKVSDVNQTAQSNSIEITKTTVAGDALSVAISGASRTIVGSPDGVSATAGGAITHAAGKGGDGTGAGGAVGGSASLLGGDGGDETSGLGGADGGPVLVKAGNGGSDSLGGFGANGATASLLGGDAGFAGFGNPGFGGNARVDAGGPPGTNGGRVLIANINAYEIASGNGAAAGPGVAWSHQGRVKILAPAALDLLGTPGMEIEPQSTETQGTRTFARWHKYTDLVAGLGADVEILIVDGDPNGQVTAGNPGSLAIDPNTGTMYGKDANPSTWSAFSKGGATGKTISQAMDAEVTGTTFLNVGTVYLPAGSLAAPARIWAGATTAGPDAAEVELRRETGGTLIATWTAPGTLQEMTQGGATAIPADDWYNIRLRGNGPVVVAKLKGIDWVVT